MSTHTDTSHTVHAEEHEHGGPALYAKVVVALLIATIKASLVALFFMHLRWEKPVNSIIAVAGFLFLGIFLMFDLIDADTRNYYLPQNLHRTEIPLTPG